MKRFVLIILFVIFLASCSSLNFLESDPDTTSRKPVESTNTWNSELTILYPYVYQVNEYEQIFNELNAISKDVLGVTARMITLDEDKTKPGGGAMFLRHFLYWDTLELMRGSGLNPDIFVVLDTYSVSKSLKCSLHHAVQSGHAADITDFINSETPYLTRLVQEYPNILPLMSVQNKIYGIITPVTYMHNPVFFVHKTISGQLDNRNIHTMQDAINACIEINDKKLLGPQDQIYFSDLYVLDHIIHEAGYDRALSDSIYYMYYVKQNDTSKIYRLEETTILENLFIYRDLFEKNSIDTKKMDNEKRLIAGVDSYNSILTEEYHFNKDKLEYDVHFLEGSNSILTGQGNADQHNMFVVSETCYDKQAAVRYINWLYSDVEANKLIKYGIEGKNYKVDSTGLLYTDETVTGLWQYHSLFNGFTVDTGILTPESIYITEREETMTHNILSNYKINTATKLILDSITIDPGSGTIVSIADEYVELTYKMDFNTWRIQEESSVGRLFYELLDYKNEATYTEIYYKISDSRKDNHVNAIKNIFDNR